ncbi:YDG domain-containing protein [Janthinobacterium psychrotolerans]|uniref:YDG domain-containing protein n=1 Tax=Janthinobacterium psychrotolerans TaxID=1747903 RepID=UPI00080675D7|nr:YDG domain-containing protein [Janthinobacterium psychrotolerans]
MCSYGNGKTVKVEGIVLIGTDAGNYTLTSNAASTTADISRAAINAVTGITAGSKTYDGTTAATVNTSAAAFNGMVTGDSLNASASGTFANKNAATGKTVSVSGIALGGADAGNYTLASNTASTTADISRAAINGVTGIKAGSKVYDGTTAATVSTGSAVFAGMVAGDSLSASASGAFVDKNAAKGKTVNVSGIALSGFDAGNYTLVSNQARATANITPASLVVAATGANRVYDTTSNASVALSDNRIAGDVLSISNTGASFATKNAGVNKTVTVSGIALGGADAGNYVVNTTASTTATIGQAALSVRVDSAAKNQGSANPAFTASYTGLLGADTVVGEVGGNLAFTTDATAGSVVGAYAVSAGGQTAVNYALAYTPGVLTVNPNQAPPVAAPTPALQAALSSALGTLAVAASQGDMVQANTPPALPATQDAVTGKDDAAVATTQALAFASRAAPVLQVQAGPVVNTNVVPGLRLSVVGAGLRMPAGVGDSASVESE